MDLEREASNLQLEAMVAGSVAVLQMGGCEQRLSPIWFSNLVGKPVIY
jgi:hypothetical protein